MLFYLCTVVVAASLVLGGATQAGFLSDAALQILAVPLLLVSVWRLDALLGSRRTRGLVLFCLLLAALPLAQLIPLPPEIWTRLPKREQALETFELLGSAPTWLPLTLSPHATWLSALSLLPPLAVFLAAVQLSPSERQRLSLVILAVGLVGVIVGLLQVAQGPASPLRFFSFTNPSEAVGFFANRNHFSALLYCLTLLAVAWSVHLMLSGSAPQGMGTTRTVVIVGALASFTVLVCLVAAQLMARSRAGLGLTIVALIGAAVLGFTDRRNANGITPTKILMGATALAVLFASQFALYRILQRFAADPFEDARVRLSEATLVVAKVLMPLGAGMGTFVPGYALFEAPKDAFRDVFANRAHNDILEVWFEAGVPGLLLLTVFAAWFVVRAFRLWRTSASPGRELDHLLARAATLIVVLVAAHSVVDYPLRTTAMLSTMAFVAALMVEPDRRKTSDPAGHNIVPGKPPPPIRPGSASPPELWRLPSGPPPLASTPLPSSRATPGSLERWSNPDTAWPKEWVSDPKRSDPTDRDDSG